ncbi:hypothetical protein K461DRAFT_266223 [Myriangium duriaei CBS 260.36]|uniref:Uncharacterized protein n=1 Tax=Myriangium duriaei CBS 260.36 TaxID=1168546 RepID=A0A9P4J830_9PEZI|nr:hypothetical protein K461DRAFT_266223 [Myriangium duriaei CBS 260.36]
MTSSAPYYNNSTQVDLSQAIDPSFQGYENDTNQPSRYPDSSYQANHGSNPELIADLHNLVAAAHSVAEQEQNQAHTGEAPHPVQVSSSIKRKPPNASAKGNSNKRRKKTPVAAADDSTDMPDPAESITTRPQGIHSSAALFRPASDKSKKWTRPPMNTLFNSFRLPPERFLELQADAKDFMLDPAFPKRKDLVGVRGKADIKSVKLELARTVRQFLEEGAGERYFGGAPNDDTLARTGDDKKDEDVTVRAQPNVGDVAHGDTRGTTEEAEDPSQNPDAPFRWSRDRELIIDLCMPLLRRVVTNEKQRQYAESTRRAVRETAKEAETEAVVPSDVDTISVRVYFVSVGKAGEAIVGKQTQTRVPLDGNATDGGGNTQWTRICSLLDPEALTKGIRVQTAEGLVKVVDQTTCSEAVKKVLAAPWLERTVRIVIGGDEAQSVRPPAPADP